MQMNITLRYSAFALLSIVVNLATQETSLLLYSGSYALLLSVIAGTATGLVTKYMLDKKYIFGFKPAHLAQDINKFLGYAVTGLFTTGIFWGFEFGFEYMFGGKLARYTGAVTGLTIGYFIKYRLDKHLVFVQRETQ